MTVLLSSDISSEGSIAIVKKFVFDFFMIFFIPHHSHNLKLCFRKIYVCMCVSVCRSPNVEPKPIGPYRSNSIYRVLVQISRAVFSFPPTPKIKGSSQKKKKEKFSNFSKMALTILIKFCGFIVHSKPNNTWHYRLFPKKSLKLEK